MNTPKIWFLGIKFLRITLKSQHSLTETVLQNTRQSLATRADSEDGMGTDLLGSGSGQLGPGLGGWGAGRRPWQLVHTRPGTHLESGIRALSAPVVGGPAWPRELRGSSLTSGEGGCCERTGHRGDGLRNISYSRGP